MTITLSEEVERALKARAAKRGTSPDELANQTLKRELLSHPTDAGLQPKDEWEKLLLSVPLQTGVSLTDEQVSREAIYED
jgi:hypothetical protein